MDYQEASNDYDMLEGCINRMFVTDDIKEMPHLYAGAVYHLGDIYKYGMERLERRNEKTNVTDRQTDATDPDHDA